MAITDILGGLDFGFGGISGLISIFLISLFSLIIAGGIIFFFMNRKKWNLVVEFKLPRGVKYAKGPVNLDVNDVNALIDSEIGKGSYNSKRGVVILKRKGKKAIHMKPFNINKFLQGSNHLTVVQVGSEEFIPVMPETYTMYYDQDSGTYSALLNLSPDKSQSKSWSKSFERESKQAFSALGLLKENATFIAIGLVIFLWGIQFLVLYNRIKG